MLTTVYFVGFSEGSGSEEEEKNKKHGLEKGNERDMGGEDKTDKGYEGDRDSSDEPEDVPGDRGGPAKISFEIAFEIHPGTIQEEEDTFQTFTMHGSLIIEVFLYHYHIVVLPN